MPGVHPASFFPKPITFSSRSQIKLGFCRLVIDCIQWTETLYLRWNVEITDPTVSGGAYTSSPRERLANNTVLLAGEAPADCGLHNPGGTTGTHGHYRIVS